MSTDQLVDDEPMFACDDAAAMSEAIDRRNAKIARLTARIAELEKALGWFLSDDRFRVAVGGSPHVVEKMIADARTTLEASERGGGE